MLRQSPWKGTNFLACRRISSSGRFFLFLMVFFYQKQQKIGMLPQNIIVPIFSTSQLDEHQEPWATSEPLAMRLPSQTVQVWAAVIIVLFCFLHRHYYCHIHHHHSLEQSNMRRYWSVWKVKRRYEAYAQLELLLLLHTFGDFSSPNWGTVKLKWMLPENHTQRNIVTNTTRKYKY